jgi:hypothetical protein
MPINYQTFIWYEVSIAQHVGEHTNKFNKEFWQHVSRKNYCQIIFQFSEDSWILSTHVQPCLKAGLEWNHNVRFEVGFLRKKFDLRTNTTLKR